MKTRLKRYIILFFVFMGGVTVLSRIVYGLCVIKVVTGFSTYGEISQTIEGNGKIQGKEEIVIVSEEGILITKLNVSVGQEVKEGEVLYEVGVNDIDKMISQKEDELESIKLQSEDIIQQDQQKINQAAMNYNHAKENYDAAIINKNVVLQNARQEIEKANQEKVNIESELEKRGTQEAEKEEEYAESQGLEEQLNIAILNLEEKELTYKQTEEVQENNVRTSRQELERAGLETAAIENKTVQQNDIIIQQKQKEISRLKEIMEKECVLAPSNAIVKSILISEGNRTTNSADMILTEKSKGGEVVATFVGDGSELLGIGDLVQIDTKSNDNSWEEFPINSIKMVDEETNLVEAKIETPNMDSMLGRMVAVKYVTEAKEYQNVIERTALHIDSNEKYYVYILEERETLLGKELEALKREVQVLDKNENYVAVEGISNNDEVVLEATRYIENGDRVKRKNNEM